MYQITNKDRDELISLLGIQIESFSDLNKVRRLTGKERTITSKAKYLEHKLSQLKKINK